MKDHILLNQGVGTHHHLSLSRGNGRESATPISHRQAALEKDHLHTQGLKPFMHF